MVVYLQNFVVLSVMAPANVNIDMPDSITCSLPTSVCEVAPVAALAHPLNPDPVLIKHYKSTFWIHYK